MILILEFTVSMFSGYMGPRASKNAFTVYSAISQGKNKSSLWPEFGPILYGDFGHFEFE